MSSFIVKKITEKKEKKLFNKNKKLFDLILEIKKQFNLMKNINEKRNLLLSENDYKWKIIWLNEKKIKWYKNAIAYFDSQKDKTEENIIKLKKEFKKELWKSENYITLINDFAILTQGFSWRDLKNTIDIFTKKILLNNKDLNFKLFFDSLEEFIMWKEKKIYLNKETLYRISVHEIWHAIIWHLIWKKILKVSVWEKDMSLWQTYSIDKEEELLKNKNTFISEIKQLLWWRYWEIIMLWDYSTWAANDYERATNLAISYFHNNLDYVVKNDYNKEIKKWDKLKIWLLLNKNFNELPWKIQDQILEYSKILIFDLEKEVFNILIKYKDLIKKYWEYLKKEKVLIWWKLSEFLNEIDILNIKNN